MRGSKPPGTKPFEGMTTQVEKTSADVWKGKEAVTSTPGIGPAKATKRLTSPKKSQEMKKLNNEMRIEDVFLNSEYFKYHTGGNLSSLSFCSGDFGENQWTVDRKSEVLMQQKSTKNIPNEIVKSDTAVTSKAKQTPTLNTKNSAFLSGEHPEEKTNKLLKGILSGKGRLDRDLISLITDQMFLAERELQITRTHLVETISKLNERDLEILQLHEKIQNLQINKKIATKKEKPDGNLKTSEDYQRLVLASEKLKKQVSDMEEFLNDYGLVWVGEKETKPDFDKIVKSFQRLNSVASEPKIIQTTMGAKFELPREIPIVLYANGILLRDRDFREYGNVATTLFLQDVEDGFFPSELQVEFPEGVPFEVVDKRNEVYVVGVKTPPFQGHGNRLGSTIESKPSSLVYLEPLKKVRSFDVGCHEPSKKYLTMKSHKKRARSGALQGEKTAMAAHLQEVDAGEEEETSPEELLNVKVRFGGERTRSFFLQVKEKERMFEFQVVLQRKLCEMFHDDYVAKGLTNSKSTDFEVHVYGRSPFRLSDHLQEFPVDCGIVNNCVINVSEI